MDREPTLEVGVNTEETKKVLAVASRVGALLTGEFTLTSGKKSTFYFDAKKLTLSPEGAYHIGKAIFDQLAENEIDAVGGVATGAYPIVSAVAVVSYLEGKLLPAFIVREVAKEHGTKRQIEGYLKAGSRIAIVDDVLTTGGSVLKAIEAVEAAKCQVARVIVLVDRHEGGGDELRKRGYDCAALLNLVH